MVTEMYFYGTVENNQHCNPARSMPLVAVHDRFINRDLDGDGLHHVNWNMFHHGEWNPLLNLHRDDLLDRRGNLLLHFREHLLLHLRRGKVCIDEKSTNCA